jgi:glycosyltransferase involved in cell wall biosynthesis
MLASGLPVVAYELPVFRELFESVIQLVPSRFPQEAAMKIIHLLEDPQRARHEGIKGADFVRQFGYREVADQELDFIQELPNPSWAKAVDS